MSGLVIGELVVDAAGNTKISDKVLVFRKKRDSLMESGKTFDDYLGEFYGC